MAMRFTLGLFAALLAASNALAQPAPPPPPMTPPPLPPETQTPPPAKPQTYTPAPPPAADSTTADPDEPQVTIIRRETETVEEVRVGGQLRYIRVTPRFGLPYFLVPNGNGQQFIRRDSLDPALSPPMWLLFSW